MKTSRIAIHLVVLACTLLLLLPTSLTAADPKAKAAPKKAAAEKVVPPEEGLRKHIDRFTFAEIELEKVIEFLQDYMDTNVVVRWNRLLDVEISRDTMVSVNLKDIPVETALKVILWNTDTPSDTTLGYTIRDGVLVISTSDDLRETTTVVYDVSEIVDGLEPSETGRLTDALIPFGVGGERDVQLVGGSLIVSADNLQHEKIRAMIDQLKKNLASRPPSPRALARQSQDQIKTILSMKDTCFDPQAMCVVALGCLRSETKETPEQLATTLESLLAETKALGVRNAMRMTLKDLYGQMGNTVKVKKHLEGIIKDNAQAALGETGLSSGLGGR